MTCLASLLYTISNKPSYELDALSDDGPKIGVIAQAFDCLGTNKKDIAMFYRALVRKVSVAIRSTHFSPSYQWQEPITEHTQSIADAIMGAAKSYVDNQIHHYLFEYSLSQSDTEPWIQVMNYQK